MRPGEKARYITIQGRYKSTPGNQAGNIIALLLQFRGATRAPQVSFGTSSVSSNYNSGALQEHPTPAPSASPTWTITIQGRYKSTPHRCKQPRPPLLLQFRGATRAPQFSHDRTLFPLYYNSGALQEHPNWICDPLAGCQITIQGRYKSTPCRRRVLFYTLALQFRGATRAPHGLILQLLYGLDYNSGALQEHPTGLIS